MSGRRSRRSKSSRLEQDQEQQQRRQQQQRYQQREIVFSDRGGLDHEIDVINGTLGKAFGVRPCSPCPANLSVRQFQDLTIVVFKKAIPIPNIVIVEILNTEMRLHVIRLSLEARR